MSQGEFARPTRGRSASRRLSWRDGWASRRPGSIGWPRPGPSSRLPTARSTRATSIASGCCGRSRTSGVPLDALIAASAAGRISLRYYDELHPPPDRAHRPTLRAFAASLGDRRPSSPSCSPRSGSRSPTPDVELSTDDESALADCLDALAATGEPDLALRAIRMFGEGARRGGRGPRDLRGGRRRTGEDIAGLPEDEAFDRVLRPWARFAAQLGRPLAWLTRRHMSRAIDDYSIVESERILEESGFLASRDVSPPAVAFVDLTGFTRLTQEIGDEAAAALALRLGDVAVEVVRPRGGRVVKLLGDGVLIRFADVHGRDGDPRPARALPAIGLRPGHAGIASGPLIARDGDIFGRTVNLAARIADAAPGRPPVGVPRRGRGDVVARNGLRLTPAPPGDAPGPRPGARSSTSRAVPSQAGAAGSGPHRRRARPTASDAQRSTCIGGTSATPSASDTPAPDDSAGRRLGAGRTRRGDAGGPRAIPRDAHARDGVRRLGRDADRAPRARRHPPDRATRRTS